MKSILAIETSTACGSVALLIGPKAVFESSFRADRSHNSRLFEPLRQALEAGRPDLIAVGAGPGSYTGVRVAVAAAQGIGLARNIPVIAWPSLCAFAAPERCQVVGDARRGSFFLATMAHGRLAGEIDVVPQAEVAARLLAPIFTFDDETPWNDAQFVQPSATKLAEAVARLEAAEVAALAARAPEPLYLRAPFTTTPKVRPRGDGLRPSRSE